MVTFSDCCYCSWQIPMIFNGDCLDMLEQMEHVPLIIADPPDNLGLKYNSYTDKRPDYDHWLFNIITKSIQKTDCFWLSYYWKHDFEIKGRLYPFLRKNPHVTTKTFIWRYTFGQHNSHDFGSGYRYLLRFTKPSCKFNPNDILVRSKRQMLGDTRANPAGRVPDDVWDFPRVTGNSSERRKWHPTQHPEALIRRIILMHTDPDDLVVDLFGGTGTTLRVALAEGRRALTSEIDESYCQHISQESGVPIVKEI